MPVENDQNGPETLSATAFRTGGYIHASPIVGMNRNRANLRRLVVNSVSMPKPDHHHG